MACPWQAVFGLSEQLTHPLNLWHATDSVAWTLGNVAVYVLPAEAVLGPAALVAHRLTAGRGGGAVVAAAVATSLLYTGALAVAFLFMERLPVR